MRLPGESEFKNGGTEAKMCRWNITETLKCSKLGQSCRREISGDLASPPEQCLGFKASVSSERQSGG